MAITKGQLISDCLKLMNENEDQIDAGNVSDNAEFMLRTVNIIESINRALYRANELGKLPKKVLYITYDTEAEEKGYYHSKYSINTLGNGEIFKIDSIALLKANGEYTTHIDVRYEGSDILVLNTLDNPDNYLNANYPEIVEEKYIVVYTPKIQELSYSDEDTLELDYPNELLRKVPYFVVGELYVEDNPNIAFAYRDMYEAYLNKLPDYEENRNSRIQLHYTNIHR
jgi:hypothetical protein